MKPLKKLGIWMDHSDAHLVEYKLNEKLDIFCEGKYMYNLRLESSYNYTYYTIGAGINFFINRDTDKVKEEND